MRGMLADSFEYKLDILKSEISTIQARIGAYDDLSFRVKGWAATLWAGLVGYALANAKMAGIVATIPLMVVFWILDAFFKKYQQRVRARMGVIERFINCSGSENEPSLDRAFQHRQSVGFVVHDPMCYSTRALGDGEFKAYIDSKCSLHRALITSNVLFLYAGLIVGSTLLLLCRTFT